MKLSHLILLFINTLTQPLRKCLNSVASTRSLAHNEVMMLLDVALPFEHAHLVEHTIWSADVVIGDNVSLVFHADSRIQCLHDNLGSSTEHARITRNGTRAVRYGAGHTAR